MYAPLRSRSQLSPGNASKHSPATYSFANSNNHNFSGPKDELSVNRRAPLHDFNSISVFHSLAGSVQPSLAINTPGDKYEQEADAMANKIMQMPEIPSVQQNYANYGAKGKLQRKSLSGGITTMPQIKRGAGSTANPGFNNRIAASQGRGASLDPSTQSFMSNRFGVDFSNVKVHTDNEAAKMNSGLNARAFTLNNDIYFNKGEYKPESSEGKKLLAHELTHVVQQKSEIKRQIIQRDSPASGAAPLKLQPGSLDLRDNASPLLASALGSTEISGFATGSSSIPKEGEDKLRYHANQILYFLKKYPMATVRIMGHTDKVGKDGSNLALGQQRADAVRDFLLAEGVPIEIITAESKGESNPLKITKDEVGEPRNRRVEVFFQVKSTSLTFGSGTLTPPGAEATTTPPPVPPPFNRDITKLPERRVPYRDPGDTALWSKMKDISDKLDRLPPRKETSIRDFVIEKIMDEIRPITKHLPDIPLLGRPEDLIRKALEKGSEALCEETINMLDIGEDAKTVLRESCKRGITQGF